MVWKTKA